MWRRLVARCHPDQGGDHDLFVWAQNVREHVASDAIEPPISRPRQPRYTPPDSVDRVDYPSDIGGREFQETTRKIVALAPTLQEPYRSLLLLLSDCETAMSTTLRLEEQRGASYKRLAAIGHIVGMDKAMRSEWYEIARRVPLSDRHARHILWKLREERR